MDFYDNLERELQSINNLCIIVSGDWNATWDPSPVHSNIDVINMRNIPSKRRSERVNAMARNLSLTDPYRFLHPQKREFTFVPNIAGNQNRSRIDFFLVSENILTDCKSVTIPHHLASKMFDHKYVQLNFHHFHNRNTQKIKDCILKDLLLPKVIKAQTFDCYNNHATITENHSLQNKTAISLKIGQILTIVKQIQETRKNIIDEGFLGNNRYEHHTARISELFNEIDRIFMQLPDQEFFENLQLECEDDIFFEILTMSLKNETLSFQSTFFAQKNAQKKSICEQIRNLKQNYQQNSDEIFRLESRLSTIVDTDLKAEIATIKNFERLNDEKITPHFLRLAKSQNSGESISILTQENGEPFATETDRENHILSFYRKLYKALPLHQIGKIVQLKIFLVKRRFCQKF
jgi:hypothetical protein